MMGMSAPEWSRYMHEVIGLSESPAEIDELVVERMLARYADRLPLIDGAVEAVLRLRQVVPARARVVVEPKGHRRRPRSGRHRLVVRGDGLVRGGRAVASPHPTSSSRRRDGSAVAADRCVAIEDSGNGIRAAHAAGMRVLAIPNRRYPPPPDALALAGAVLQGLSELTPDLVAR